MPHFEIHATDVEAAKTFYSGLFGWQFEPMPGGEDMAYHLIEGADIGMAHGVTGGLMKRMGDAPAAGGPVRGGTMTFEVDDCDERYSWALGNGGAEALPPQDYPGIGRCAYVEDGQGNIVGMITPAESN
ncbi:MULTISPECIES: VOC family protein [unclassified Leisingera]|uniref:VOC family protein n=1 Tax=unclassified Leisingera TaxID=2614906 RepID=UPI0010127EE0|nr:MULTISPECIES: VOC family protein [unclassified Leisingera]MBQ4823380.1 VOC family protein [Leisingera sp. HS039]QAX29750.1 VOC family protein [Leisingera sp. NJS204]QBR36479.1 VOC family protein [Leisingera sp. NJS201]